MTYTLNQIEELAFANLSVDELDTLADHLWRRVHGDEIEEGEDDEFLAELERRALELDQGKVKSLSHEQVMEHMRKKFGWT